MKVSDHSAVLPGETLVYTITIDNASPILITNVTVTDTLPDGFEYVEMIVGNPPVDTTPPTIEWQNQTIPAGGQLVLVFRVLVPGSVGTGAYKNEVIASTPLEVCIKGTGETALVEVVDEIIRVTKTVNPREVPPLGVVRYEIRLLNMDSVPITGVSVTDTLPSMMGEHFTFVGMAMGDPEPSEINGPQVIWRNLTVPGGRTFPQRTLKLRFDARAPIFFGNYDNQLDGSCPRAPITPDEELVKATVFVQPGVVLYKTVSPAQTVNNQTVLYTITLSNQWTALLADVRITDTLPADFSYYRRVSGPDPIQTSPVVVWELSQLIQGDSQEFVFEALVGQDVISGTHFNEVEGVSPSALIPGTGETAPVVVLSVPKLDISKDGPATAIAGELITYTLTVTNSGGALATDLVISDVVPAGASFVQALDGGVLVGGSVVRWTVPSLAIHDSVVVRFVVTATATIVNSDYQVIASGGYSAVGSESVVTTISTPSPDLVISKDGPATATAGEPITYTLTVANNGSASATNLIITDVVPAGASFVQALDGGVLIGGSVVQWTVPSLAASDSTTVRFVVTAIETITNSEYGVSADGGYGAVGSVSVVTIIGGTSPPQADFSASPTMGLAPLTVVFSNESSGGYTERQWDFGDGATSTDENPTHVYTLVGTYAVSLTVNGPGGSDTEIKTGYVTVLDKYKLYLPLVLKGYSTAVTGPDLIIQSLTTVPANPAAGQAVEVQVVIKNQGTMATDGWFYVDLYVDPASPPASPADLGTHYAICAGLGSGATYTAVFHHTFAAGGTHTLYAQVDTEGAGQVQESNEGNNIYGPVTVSVSGARQGTESTPGPRGPAAPRPTPTPTPVP